MHTALGLAYFASHVNSGNDYTGKTVILTANVDISENCWVPIGQAVADNNALDTTNSFKGTFDGGGHYVDGMIINGTDYTSGSGAYNEANGLFGVNDGTIKNVGVINAAVDTYRRGAGIAGINYGTVMLCMSSGDISANGGGGTRGTGGIVGSNYGLVSSCYSSANVYNAYRRAGGIVGYNAVDNGRAGIIENCVFIGNASSDSATYSGSIACANDAAASIYNCYYAQNSAKDDQVNGVPTGYANGAQAYEFNPATANGTLTGVGGSGNTLRVYLPRCSGAFKFPSTGSLDFILVWEESGYDWNQTFAVTLPDNVRGGSLTVTTEFGTAVTSGDAFPLGTKLILSTTQTTEDIESYIFDAFTASYGSYVLRLAGSASGGAVYVVTKTPVTLSAAYKGNAPIQLTLGEYDDFVVTAKNADSVNLPSGTDVHVGDVITLTATLKDGVFPADTNKRYSGTFSYPSASNLGWTTAKITAATSTGTYTILDADPGDALDFTDKITANTPE